MDLTIKDDFARFLIDESGCSGRGTVSTCVRALDVLSKALNIVPWDTGFQTNVWQINSIEKLHALYEYVKNQQYEYAKHGTGLFSYLKNGGQSYYKNRWCSAAVKQLAAYRQTRIYESKLQEAFCNTDQGRYVSETAQKIKFKDPSCFIMENINPSSREGKEQFTNAKRRINQSIFRRWILGIYGNECCITGLNIPQTLRASHITPWAQDKANRMNPSNGLCLSATYDAAFDQHLISLDEDYRVILSSCILDFCTREICASYFKKYEGAKIKLPVKFLPDRHLLEKHRARLAK